VAGAAAAAEESAPAKKPPMGIIIGAVVAVVAIAVVLFLVMRKPGPPPEPKVSPEAQAAFEQARSVAGIEKWGEASRLYRRAQDLGYPAEKIKPLIDEADLETPAKQNLDSAERVFNQGDPDTGIEKLKRIPDRSRYYGTAQEKITEYRDEAIRLHLKKAQDKLDDKKYEDALGEVLQVLGLDPDNARAKALQTLVEKKMAETPKPPPPPPEPKKTEKSPEQREAEANDLMKAANADVLRQDYRSAIDKLLKAVALKPSPALLGKIYRSLGVSHAKLGENCKAGEYYKKYIETVPNTPERPTIERMLNQLRQSGACPGL
jgi:tetratricopeptide (TPR) repeat protein